RPQCAKLQADVILSRMEIEKLPPRAAYTLTAMQPLNELLPGLAGEPLIGVSVQAHQFLRAELCQIAACARSRLAISDFVDSPAIPMHAVAIRIFSLVAPVGDEDPAVRTIV